MDGQIRRQTENLTDKAWICDFDEYPTIGELINLPCRLKTQSFEKFYQFVIVIFSKSLKTPKIFVLCNIVNFEFTGWVWLQNLQYDNCCHIVNFVFTSKFKIYNMTDVSILEIIRDVSSDLNVIFFI